MRPARLPPCRLAHGQDSLAHHGKTIGFVKHHQRFTPQSPSTSRLIFAVDQLWLAPRNGQRLGDPSL